MRKNSKKAVLPRPVCTVESCDKESERKGMCWMHYQRRWRHGSTDERPRVNKPRTQFKCMECEEPAKSKNLCAKHYARWLRNGADRPTCFVGGCGQPRYSKGFCMTHYQRMRKTGITDLVRSSTEERFWKYVAISADEECWLWTGAHQTLGYGLFWGDGERLPAHRYSWELANGRKIPSGHHIDHLCRTPACVNPAHLEPVTPRENTRRAYAAIEADLPHCPTCTCEHGVS